MELKQQTDSGSDDSTCSVLPAEAGFYWWRKDSDEEWRMVQIIDFRPQGPPHLCTYDVEHHEWRGRSLAAWEKHDLPGEWIKLHKPND